MRALPAITASAAATSASMPEWVEPGEQGAARLGCESERGRRGTRGSGPRRTAGGSCPTTARRRPPDRCRRPRAPGSRPPRRGSACPRRERRRPTWPRPPDRPHAVATSAAGSRSAGAAAPTATMRAFTGSWRKWPAESAKGYPPPFALLRGSRRGSNRSMRDREWAGDAPRRRERRDEVAPRRAGAVFVVAAGDRPLCDRAQPRLDRTGPALGARRLARLSRRSRRWLATVCGRTPHPDRAVGARRRDAGRHRGVHLRDRLGCDARARASCSERAESIRNVGSRAAKPAGVLTLVRSPRARSSSVSARCRRSCRSRRVTVWPCWRRWAPR